MATATVDGDAIVTSDSIKRKNVLHKNFIQKSANEAKNKCLEAQRKVKEAQLCKEEKEVRAQLQRLREEQRALAGATHCELSPETHEFLLWEDCEYEIDNDENSEVVNPYPVTIVSSRTRKSSVPTRLGAHQDRRLYQRRRRESVEFEDLDIHPATGQVRLPNLQRTVSSRNLLLPPTPTSDLQNNDSLWSLKSASPKEKDGHFWLGQPEAICSVRRPRKTAGRQKIEHTRSKSLKERPASMRSRKARERIGSPNSPGGKSPQSPDVPARAWSRSSSLKEQSRGKKNVEEDLALLSIGTRRQRSLRAGHPRCVGSSHSSRSSLSDLATSPDSKSSMWGNAEEDGHSGTASSVRSSEGLPRASESTRPVAIKLSSSSALPPLRASSEPAAPVLLALTTQNLHNFGCKPKRRLARSPLALDRRPAFNKIGKE